MSKKEDNVFFQEAIGRYDYKWMLRRLGDFLQTIDNYYELLPSDLKQTRKYMLKYLDTVLLNEEEKVNETFGIYKVLPITNDRHAHNVVLPTGDVFATNKGHTEIGRAENYKLSPWKPSAKAQEKYDKLVQKCSQNSVAATKENQIKKSFSKKTTMTPIDFRDTSLFLYWQLRGIKGQKMIKSRYDGPMLSDLRKNAKIAEVAYTGYAYKEDTQDAILSNLKHMCDTRDNAVKDYCENWLTYKNNGDEPWRYNCRPEHLFSNECIVKEDKKDAFLPAFNDTLMQYLSLQNQFHQLYSTREVNVLQWTKGTLAKLVTSDESPRSRIENSIVSHARWCDDCEQIIAVCQPKVNVVASQIDALKDMLLRIDYDKIIDFIDGDTAELPESVREYLYFMRACERPVKTED